MILVFLVESERDGVDGEISSGMAQVGLKLKVESLGDDRKEQAVGSLNLGYREQGLFMESLEGGDDGGREVGVAWVFARGGDDEGLCGQVE